MIASILPVALGLLLLSRGNLSVLLTNIVTELYAYSARSVFVFFPEKAIVLDRTLPAVGLSAGCSLRRALYGAFTV